MNQPFNQNVHSLPISNPRIIGSRFFRGRNRQRLTGIFAVAVLLFPQTGCYERNLAPPVEYSQEELDKLNA
ncbi:MAG: hypothetical protein AAF456_22240, partial [Planctomycetota bacterium]